MTVLVAGAADRTGRLLVEQLLSRNQKVRAIARSRRSLPDEVLNHPNATVIEASLLDLTDEEMAKHVSDCDAVVSCLGHTMDFMGMFGEPIDLCTQAARRLCAAIERNGTIRTTKFILMNTEGVQNPDLAEKRSWHERALLAVLRRTVPPHRDNETAATFLHQVLGKESGTVEWCSVRPDSLIDAETSAYDIKPSPTTGILSSRPTARANVAHFVTDLTDNADLWSAWKFRMPVIMNQVS